MPRFRFAENRVITRQNGVSAPEKIGVRIPYLPLPRSQCLQGIDSKKKGAYVTRNVARKADSPFCSKHPTGTTDACGACARARVALTAHGSTLPGLGWDCAIDGHKLVVDGTCAVCDFRPRRSVA